MSSPILLAYDFDGNGGGKNLSESEVSKKLKLGQLVWVHLDVNNEGTKQWLETEIKDIDPFTIDALLAEETRPRVTEINNGALIILRGVNLNENASPEDMVSIRLWVEKHRIITLRRRKLKAVLDIEDKLKLGKGPKDVGSFVSGLISKLFERMEPVLTDLDEDTDTIEENVLKNPDLSLRGSIVNIRMKAIGLRRYMAPQKDAIGQLRSSDLDFLSVEDRRHLQESYDRVLRYVEDLDAVRERAQIVKDELASVLADKLNKNMYVLSVIAAIFLPMGFLTGLFGINVGGIPGTDDKNAFWVFCILLSGIVALQVFLFKKLKWF
jgi:zinc transporter